MATMFCLEVKGAMACFTRPEMKVERVSYDVITPSAARAIFEAVFWKPAIRWQIIKIEVINPIRWASIRRNEVGKRVGTPTAKHLMGEAKDAMGINIEEERQQRAAMLLRDVRYRLYAELHFDASKDPEADYGKYVAMFERRARRGQCFNQPYLGTREFSCDFRLIDRNELAGEPPAIQEDRELGWMLYDLDFSDVANPVPRFFQARIKHGVVIVPEWNSEEVRG